MHNNLKRVFCRYLQKRKQKKPEHKTSGEGIKEDSVLYTKNCTLLPLSSNPVFAFHKESTTESVRGDITGVVGGDTEFDFESFETTTIDVIVVASLVLLLDLFRSTQSAGAGEGVRIRVEGLRVDLPRCCCCCCCWECDEYEKEDVDDDNEQTESVGETDREEEEEEEDGRVCPREKETVEGRRGNKDGDDVVHVPISFSSFSSTVGVLVLVVVLDVESQHRLMARRRW
jgi:hypothetical protein